MYWHVPSGNSSTHCPGSWRRPGSEGGLGIPDEDGGQGDAENADDDHHHGFLFKKGHSVSPENSFSHSTMKIRGKQEKITVFSHAKKHVIASQWAHWRGNPPDLRTVLQKNTAVNSSVRTAAVGVWILPRAMKVSTGHFHTLPSVGPLFRIPYSFQKKRDTQKGVSFRFIAAFFLVRHNEKPLTLLTECHRLFMDSPTA